MVPLLAVVKFLVVLAFCDAMTMKQIKNTGKMMRKTCMPKFKVEEETLDKLTEGIFTEDKEVMCYMACVMKMANAMKNGKINYEAAMKQADLLLPDEIKEPTKAALTACKKVRDWLDASQKVTLKMFRFCCLPDKYKDACEAAYHTTVCIYKENPDIFYFP